MGVVLHADGGGGSFRVWAPHARAAAVEVQGGDKMPLQRDGDRWAAHFGPGDAPATPSSLACTFTTGILWHSSLCYMHTY